MFDDFCFLSFRLLYVCIPGVFFDFDAIYLLSTLPSPLMPTPRITFVYHAFGPDGRCEGMETSVRAME